MNAVEFLIISAVNAAPKASVATYVNSSSTQHIHEAFGVSLTGRKNANETRGFGTGLTRNIKLEWTERERDGVWHLKLNPLKIWRSVFVVVRK